jgi:hypothetical protein
MITCSGCGGATKPKNITTKRGPSTVHECISGCVNEKGYALGTFAPRQAVPPGLRPAPKIDMSDEILRCLLRIEQILANPNKMHSTPAEMGPDEEIPF